MSTAERSAPWTVSPRASRGSTNCWTAASPAIRSSFAGLPGTGKTILSEQSLSANAAQDVREGSELAIAGGIIFLYDTEEAEQQKHYLRIMKMRGTPFFGGEHFFDSTAEGIIVYPRMAPQTVGKYALPRRRVGSAIAGFNEMLGGGVYEGTSAGMLGEARRRELLEVAAARPELVERER